jgi:RNA polymerase sigma factor (sigma-70 family)
LEASALNQAARLPAVAGKSPLLRLQTDEKLIALIRRGHHGAFEALVQRYQARLLAFCRHMLNSTEDAEDVLQEVFAASFNAICADQRPINARPWLYRIARNRCLNHLRRPVSAGQDSMDVFERDGGTTTADTVHKREEFRQIVADVQTLPETQRTALLLREIDALSYDQIAEAMDTTVPSVKSLLVRARVSLAEAAEARLLTCEEVRLELGHVAEGLAKTSPPVRRHVKMCDRCRVFKSELSNANKALAAVYPIGPFVVLKSFLLAKLGGGAASGGATAGGAGIASGAAATAGGGAAGGLLSAGVTTVASKTAAGLAAAALVTAGAVEVKHARESTPAHTAPVPAQLAAVPQPTAPAPTPAPAPAPAPTAEREPKKVKEPAVEPVEAPEVPPAKPTEAPTADPATPVEQQDGSTVTLAPGSGESGSGQGSQNGQQPSQQTSQPSTPPGESSSSPSQPQPAPVAGEPSKPPSR